jgi:CheY-like chemotaxis protein
MKERVLSELDVRFELNPMAVFRNCPEDPGVYTIESKEGDVLLLAYARNLTQAVTRHLPENELKNEVVRRRGRFFRFFLTDDEGYVAKIFDTYVSRKGRFPDGMPQAPEGSEWFGKPSPSRRKATSDPQPKVETAPLGVPLPLDESSSSPPGRSRVSRNVLLVDDDVQLLVLMKELLEIEGHRVYAAANMKMLRKALEVSPLHVLVLDYHLQDMTAIHVIETLKGLFPEILIFLITGTQYKEEAYLLLKQGVSKIFPKPFSMKMLSRAIEDHFKAA